MADPTYPDLRRTRVPDPANPTRQVEVFGTWHKACEHIRDHLLTAPECHAWLLVVPSLAGELDIDDADVRWQCAEEVLKPNGGFAQPLYDQYAAAIRSSIEDAIRLGWHASDAQATVALGTTGLLTVIEGSIRTAFLPGQGDPGATTAAHGKSPDADSPLPRQRGMRCGRNGQYSGKWETCFEDRRTLFEARSRDEQVYYLVFRPAVQFIRGRQNRCRDITGNVLPGSDYALLKGVLPPMSRLKLACWLDLCACPGVIS